MLELNGVRAIELESERKVKDQLIFSRAFSTPVETAQQMRQVLSIYAQKAAHRLHRDGQVASMLGAFCSTSLFAAGMQSHPSVRIWLPVATADPVELTRAAVRLLDYADFSSARYARAGVILSDLIPANWAVALEAFEFAHERRGISEVLEAVQGKFGESAVGLGYAGLAQSPQWQMRRDLLSPRGTTHWEELVVARL